FFGCNLSVTSIQIPLQPSSYSIGYGQSRFALAACSFGRLMKISRDLVVCHLIPNALKKPSLNTTLDDVNFVSKFHPLLFTMRSNSFFKAKNVSMLRGFAHS